MFRLKLIKGLSYTGAVHATKADPYVDAEDEKTAQALIDSGYFVAVEAAETDGTATEEGEAPDVDKMTVPELEAYAKEKGIDLSDCKNKPEKVAKIKEAAETDGTADYGEGE